MMTIKIRPVFWWNSPGLGKCSRFLRSGHKRSTKKYFQLSLNFCPLTLCWDGLFWSLKALIRSSLIAFAMITRIGSLSSKLRHHFHCDSICLCTECIRLGAIVRIPKTPTIAIAQTQTSGLLSFSCLLSSSFCAFSGSYLLAERLRLTTKKMTTRRTTTARRIPITIGTRRPLEFLSVGSMEFWNKTGFYLDVFSQFSVSQAEFCSMSYNCDRCAGWMPSDKSFSVN